MDIKNYPARGASFRRCLSLLRNPKADTFPFFLSPLFEIECSRLAPIDRPPVARITISFGLALKTGRDG